MSDEIRGLSLTPPYPWLIVAETIAPGKGKGIETRHKNFTTAYRGRVAIHAAVGLGGVGGERGLYNLCSELAFFDALWRVVPGGNRYCDVGAILAHMLRYRGHIVAVATVATTYRFGEQVMVNVESGIDQPLPGEPERSFGDYRPGRVGLELANVRPLAAPVPARGMLGLWRLPLDVRERVEAQL